MGLILRLKKLKIHLPYLTKLFLLLWLMATAVFLLTFTGYGGQVLPQRERFLALTLFFVGVISFLIVILGMIFNWIITRHLSSKPDDFQDRSTHLKPSLFYILASIMLVLLLSSLLAGLTVTQTSGYLTRNLEQPSTSVSTNTTSPEPQVAGDQFMPTQDPDPYVNCRIHEKCGGGTKYVRKSVCDNSMFCCFLNDGTSKLMTKYECDNYYVNNPQNIKPSNTYDDSYNYVPNYSYPPCTLYSAVLGYSTTYYIDTETCNKWKADQEKSNQDYYDRQAISGSSSSTPSPTYSQEQWLEDCKKMADEMVSTYGLNWEQVYSGCLGGSTGTVNIGEPEPTEGPNYEGTIAY